MRRTGLLALTLATLVGPALTATLAAPASGAAARGASGRWAQGLEAHERVLDADQNFRGLDAVDARVAWVSGESLSDGAGRIFRTTDGGRHWRDVTPPDTVGLSFRDVEARSARTAFVLSIGPGDASRIYRTTDGGTTWDQVFVNDNDAAFYDCMDFYAGGRRGLAMSDPVGGRFRILSTKDYGATWQVLPSAGMPEAATEYGFAASGDCLVTAGRTAYLASGGGQARVFRSDDYGRTWTAADSTIPAGDSAGVFSLAFRSADVGLAVGGDFAEPTDGADAVARTVGGNRWRNVGDLTHLGEDVAYVPGLPGVVLVTGEYGDGAGSSVSVDGGRTWTRVADVGFHTLDCVPGACWAAGSVGRVGRVTG